MPDILPIRRALLSVSDKTGLVEFGRWLAGQPAGHARDVRLRAAMNHVDRQVAQRLPREVTALYTCGPAGGGGVRTAMRTRFGTLSCLLPREQVPAKFAFLA